MFNLWIFSSSQPVSKTFKTHWTKICSWLQSHCQESCSAHKKVVSSNCIFSSGTPMHFHSEAHLVSLPYCIGNKRKHGRQHQRYLLMHESRFHQSNCFSVKKRVLPTSIASIWLVVEQITFVDCSMQYSKHNFGHPPFTIFR